MKIMIYRNDDKKKLAYKSSINEIIHSDLEVTAFMYTYIYLYIIMNT